MIPIISFGDVWAPEIPVNATLVPHQTEKTAALRTYNCTHVRVVGHAPQHVHVKTLVAAWCLGREPRGRQLRPL